MHEPVVLRLFHLNSVQVIVFTRLVGRMDGRLVCRSEREEVEGGSGRWKAEERVKGGGGGEERSVATGSLLIL